MSNSGANGKYYVGFEYMETSVDRDKASLCLDAYQSFGWIPEDNVYSGYTSALGYSRNKKTGKTRLKFKRDRKIINKVELTRLQRHFESCLESISDLEKSKTSTASIISLGIGIIGAAFMAGSVFAVTAEPPLVILCIILAIPAFIGWILPYFVHKALVRRKTLNVTPLIEQKYDEIYEICEKGSKLL